MKKLILLLTLVPITLSLFAQVEGGIHIKLAKYYENEQWEDCAFKADRMILKDKYRNDSEVYLYLAASYNKIFLLGLVDSTLLKKVPEYANAYKLALKYSVYSKKKDRKAGFYYPENNHMLQEIAICGIYYVDHYVSEGKIAKAGSYTRKMMKTYKDLNIYFLYGTLNGASGNLETAVEVYDSVFKTMDSARPTGIENTDFMMIDGFDHYATYLMKLEEPLPDSAKNITMRGLSYFPDSELLKWNLKWIENPDIETPKPENVRKVKILKELAVVAPDEFGNKEEEIIYEEDE